MAPGPANPSDESQVSLRGDLIGVSTSGVSKLPSESELFSRGSRGRFPLALAPPATADPSSLLGKPSSAGQGGVPRKEGEGRPEIVDVGRG